MQGGEKMKKKFALLVLTMCLVVSNFTGCGGNDTPQNSTNQNTEGKQDGVTDTQNTENDVVDAYEEVVIVPAAIPTSIVYTKENIVVTYSYDKDGDAIGIEQNESGNVHTESYEYLLDENGNKVKGYNDMYPFTYDLFENLDLLASYRNESLLTKKTVSFYEVYTGNNVYMYDENNHMIKEIGTWSYEENNSENRETVYQWGGNEVSWTDYLAVQYTLSFDEYGFIENFVCNSVAYDGCIRQGEYMYNAQKQLISFCEKISRQNGDQVMLVNEYLWEFAYDSKGNLVSCKSEGDIDITYEYDNTGKLIKQNVKKYIWGDAIDYTRAYVYEADKLMSIEVDGQKEWEFSYDENARLTGVQYTALMFDMNERSQVNLLNEMELSELERYMVKQIGLRLVDELYYAEENVSWTINY